MIRLAKSIIHQPIVSLHSGPTGYRVSNIIVHPTEMAISLLEVQDRMSRYKRYLQPRDIGEISKIGIIVMDEESLSLPEDLLRQKALLENPLHIIGFAAQTVSGSRLGKVSDIAFDGTHFGITRVMVRTLPWQRLKTDSLVITLAQIERIEPGKVIVKDAYAKLKESTPKLLPA